MNIFRVGLIATVCWFATICSAGAHVTMVFPLGGEVFIPGSEITIEWRRTIQHAQLNWDLYYSPDGGATWQTIRMDIAENEFTYTWTVPKTTAATMRARIRIVHDNTGMDYEDQTSDFTIEAIAVAVDRPGEVPNRPELLSAFPNPFSSSAVIEFKTSGAEHVTLEIFDILGKKVVTLLNRSLSGGVHRSTWNAAGQAAGVYFYRLTAGGVVENKKILLVR